ncbi:hypothetical protein PBCV1_A159R [Paramecium bursaria Chlorella virus 1]|uniref:Uncharacterized protein n=1 Tax=Paramecium bursaria Chlorella virus 1 TaxID=10506 RepID=Q84479_PBCV1|nr:hypothetical protein PBCV1_A159R [Paramecium bursaria Chlorella virus 1]AAC96527.1 hypothetical protein [Paramecium bursaria Chlorella virus 1]
MLGVTKTLLLCLLKCHFCVIFVSFLCHFCVIFVSFLCHLTQHCHFKEVYMSSLKTDILYPFQSNQIPKQPNPKATKSQSHNEHQRRYYRCQQGQDGGKHCQDEGVFRGDR